MEITIAVAALAGIGSFVAPCILPMVPAFIAYISGTTITEINNRGNKLQSVCKTSIILNTLFFVLGFSLAFSTVGVLINSVLEFNTEFLERFNQIGGVIIIGFGIFLLLSFKTAKLNITRHFFPKRAKASYPLSFVFGLAFAAGWTPCVGPILGTILTLAATTPATAFNLLLAYSLGLGIPFMLIGIFFSRSTKIIAKMSKHLKYHSIIVGSFIIALGIMVYTNQLALIANFPLLNELLLWG